ncbi:tRNA pseudouridine(55) synthase TruB [Solidesulfovibrio carbinolicus]|uniref:tRNA pseudouridine synthase B n=1 Tax=Solidesulfovibrio carbinolicus TaxID=296842 RepID=A0A4P6HK64_9BACT|nr:tRNA pseudouridine(55) synthase TruB [Solidesulfovibrio carbinolicus]QAZ66874.1 tRNA pseudouridine(55) synthase TruB [Solidesulfovibrio carbinolicus]
MADKQYPLPQLHGVLVLDKPSGPTSTRCLTAIKRLGQKKIGHAGTLDPLAAGVLVVLLGEATKIAPYVMEGEKTYLGALRLGVTTDTYDSEGTVTSQAPWDHVSASALAEAIASWTELTSQEVPPYSAAKHQGRPLYELARKGLAAPVKVKDISVFDARAESVDLPSATFRVRVSAGVYIRSLVHSLGMRLGCGAIMTALTREESRPFALTQAHSLDAVLADPQSLPERIIPLDKALPHWPTTTLGPAAADDVRRGIRVPVTGDFAPGTHALLVDETRLPLALARAEAMGGRLRWAIVRGLFGDPQPARRGGNDAPATNNTP